MALLKRSKMTMCSHRKAIFCGGGKKEGSWQLWEKKGDGTKGSTAVTSLQVRDTQTLTVKRYSYIKKV